MNTVKKYTLILVVAASAVLLTYKLFANKRKLDNELKAMSEYSSVIPVEVITPEVRKPVQTIQENGITRSGGEITLLSETSGEISYVSGNPGEQVPAGQILVRVEHGVIESQFELAKLNLENAERNLERYKNMAAGEAVTEQQLENSRLNYRNALANFTNLKKQMEHTEIQSPVNGTIAQRFVEAGDNLLPSMKVFSILEKGKMVFIVKIAENDIRQIKKGQSAGVVLDVAPEKVFRGKVKSISVIPDMSGRYETEISLKENGARLLEGLDGYATFENILSAKGVVIPRKCIEGSINDATVYLVQGDIVVSRKVKATSLNETKALITEGLHTSEKVVLSGQINLQDGTRVRVINR